MVQYSAEKLGFSLNDNIRFIIEWQLLSVQTESFILLDYLNNIAIFKITLGMPHELAHEGCKCHKEENDDSNNYSQLYSCS